ncbi:MAG: phytoene desaturase family protein [Aureispira sp.]
MVQSYKKRHELADQYDTIIIGSGIGALTAGVVLAKEGQKVLMLERHYTAGGFTHVFKRKGYEWNVGVHYIGSVHKEGTIVRRLFDYISDGNIKWSGMGDVYDRIVLGDKTYDFVKGVGNWTDKMIGYFPDEEQAIRKYVHLIFEARKASSTFFLEKALSPFWSKLTGWYLRRNFLKHSRKTTHEVLSSLTNNQELIKVLGGQYGDYGLPPKQSSFAMHAILVRHYFSGGSFPIGGASEFVNHAAPIICQHGGAVLVSAEVQEIVIEKNKAVGVKMKDGKVFKAKNIVSNAGIINTYTKLLPQATVQKYQLLDYLKKVQPSVAHLCLYTGLDGTPEELQLPKANYWIYPEGKTHDQSLEDYLKDTNNDFPLVYISFPSAKDPSWPERYPGKSTIDIITLAPYQLFQEWEGSRWKKRGDDYEVLKESFAQRLLEELYKKEPQLKGKVAYYELSSPLTTKHFANYNKGQTFGLDHTPQRFEQQFLRVSTPIKGLYLTGQDVTTCGVGSAALAGTLTASAILGRSLVMKILKLLAKRLLKRKK